jgi:hypothetical protein
MSDFRTIVPMPSAFPRISYDSKILALGSCFTENIGHSLSAAKFDVFVNPNGIVYNPVSIAKCLHRILDGRPYSENELLQHNDRWHSLEHHSRFSMPTKAQTLEKINGQLEQANRHIASYSHLMLTFGTAYAYRYKAANSVVANCHKLPATDFEKIRLKVAEMVEALRVSINQLKARNPAIQIILAISPVRHLRDGLHQNNLSKSGLLLAANQLYTEMPDVWYFPSFEIVVDELRGYRFYAEDMAHPSNQAVQYIWKRFQETAMSAETTSIMKKVKHIVQAAQHRPFHPESAQHQAFLLKQLKKIEQMEMAHQGMDWTTEKEIFRAQLNA